MDHWALLKLFVWLYSVNESAMLSRGCGYQSHKVSVQEDPEDGSPFIRVENYDGETNICNDFTIDPLTDSWAVYAVEREGSEWVRDKEPKIARTGLFPLRCECGIEIRGVDPAVREYSVSPDDTEVCPVCMEAEALYEDEP